MTIDFMNVRTNLYNWAVANVPTNMPVIWYYPNAPRPTGDYISLYISTVTQIGWDWSQSPLNNTGVSNQVGDREFTLQVQGYGGDPISVLNNLRTSLQKQSVLDTLRANGIVVVNWFSINDVTDLIDSRFEQRGTFDILFRIADNYTDITGVINTVELEEIFVDANQTIVFDETITIPPATP